MKKILLIFFVFCLFSKKINAEIFVLNCNNIVVVVELQQQEDSIKVNTILLNNSNKTILFSPKIPNYFIFNKELCLNYGNMIYSFAYPFPNYFFDIGLQKLKDGEKYMFFSYCIPKSQIFSSVMLGIDFVYLKDVRFNIYKCDNLFYIKPDDYVKKVKYCNETTISKMPGSI
jgi:hypothetical protein